jgi:hypothetical protein
LNSKFKRLDLTFLISATVRQTMLTIKLLTSRVPGVALGKKGTGQPSHYHLQPITYLPHPIKPPSSSLPDLTNLERKKTTMGGRQAGMGLTARRAYHYDP